jgi:rhamnosyl/mannosyltransferase
MISSEIGTGTSFINSHNTSGLVIQPNSIDGLRNSIKLICDNPEISTRMGANSRERYKKYFTSDIMTENYIELYKN